jgi:hypothetical protein
MRSPPSNSLFDYSPRFVGATFSAAFFRLRRVSRTIEYRYMGLRDTRLKIMLDVSRRSCGKSWKAEPPSLPKSPPPFPRPSPDITPDDLTLSHPESLVQASSGSVVGQFHVNSSGPASWNDHRFNVHFKLTHYLWS